jgi:hypothetical protein
MRDTVLCIPTRSVLSAETAECVERVVGESDGVLRVVRIAGVSDVCLARNRLLTAALDSFSDAKTVFCLDDDIVFEPSDMRRVVELSRWSGRPVSGVYGSISGQLCATRHPSLEPYEGKPTYLVGLGFCAIPMRRLLSVSAGLPRIQAGLEKIVPFCTSSPSECGTYWASDDYSLSRRLGGVILEAVGVGHVKAVPLRPDAESLIRIASGQPLNPEPTQYVRPLAFVALGGRDQHEPRCRDRDTPTSPFSAEETDQTQEQGEVGRRSEAQEH